jgi:hypothetical protein
MSYSDEELITLTKFKIANNLMSFSIYHNLKMELLYEFISPIMKPNEQLKEQAYKKAEEADLIYTEYKMIKHPSGFMLFIYEGNRIRITMIMRAEIVDPNIAKNLVRMIEEFSEEFEDTYSKELKKFEGDPKIFGNIDALFKKQVSLDLSLPHYAKYVGFDPETKIQKYLFGAADLLTRKIGYFYLYNLFHATKKYVVEQARDMVLMDPKKAKKMGVNPDKVKFPPNDDFLIGIFQLRKLGMLIPIKIDELKSFTKIKYPKATQ